MIAIMCVYAPLQFPFALYIGCKTVIRPATIRKNHPSEPQAGYHIIQQQMTRLPSTLLVPGRPVLHITDQSTVPKLSQSAYLEFGREKGSRISMFACTFLKVSVHGSKPCQGTLDNH